jgi:hypothetical protein
MNGAAAMPRRKANEAATSVARLEQQGSQRRIEDALQP